MAEGFRETKQKKILREELEKFSSFFTAEELHEKAKRRDGKIGAATVYRFLGNMKKMSLLHSYICGRKSVYSGDLDSHCHFICQKCGRKMHIRIDRLDFLRKNFRGSICHFQIDISGICEDCMKNN